MYIAVDAIMTPYPYYPALYHVPVINSIHYSNSLIEYRSMKLPTKLDHKIHYNSITSNRNMNSPMQKYVYEMTDFILQ